MKKDWPVSVTQLLCPPPLPTRFTEAMLGGDVHPVNAPVKFCAQESFQVVSGIYFVAETHR